MNKRILASAVTATVIAAAAGSAVAASGSGSTSSDYNPINPVRVLDTRNDIGVGKVGPISAGGTVKVTLAGSNGVPQDATAVTMNLTATDGTAGGYLTAWPDGVQMPATSNLNYGPGETIANSVTVPVTDGAVDIHVSGAGSVQIVADLEGFYTPTAPAYSPPSATVYNATVPANDTIDTGGSAVSRATLVGTFTLNPGTYLLNLSAKATPNMTSDVQVSPSFFAYDQAISSSFAGDLLNIGGTAIESGGNTSIDSYFSGSQIVTIPATSAAPVTIYLYAFGYDSDTSAGTYTLDDLSASAIPQTS